VQARPTGVSRAGQVWRARLNGVSRAGVFAVMAESLLRAGVIAVQSV